MLFWSLCWRSRSVARALTAVLPEWSLDNALWMQSCRGSLTVSSGCIINLLLVAKVAPGSQTATYYKNQWPSGILKYSTLWKSSVEGNAPLFSLTCESLTGTDPSGSSSSSNLTISQSWLRGPLSGSLELGLGCGGSPNWGDSYLQGSQAAQGCFSTCSWPPILLWPFPAKLSLLAANVGRSYSASSYLVSFHCPAPWLISLLMRSILSSSYSIDSLLLKLNSLSSLKSPYPTSLLIGCPPYLLYLGLGSSSDASSSWKSWNTQLRGGDLDLLRARGSGSRSQMPCLAPWLQSGVFYLGWLGRVQGFYSFYQQRYPSLNLGSEPSFFGLRPMYQSSLAYNFLYWLYGSSLNISFYFFSRLYSYLSRSRPLLQPTPSSNLALSATLYFSSSYPLGSRVTSRLPYPPPSTTFFLENGLLARGQSTRSFTLLMQEYTELLSSLSTVAQVLGLYLLLPARREGSRLVELTGREVGSSVTGEQEEGVQRKWAQLLSKSEVKEDSLGRVVGMAVGRAARQELDGISEERQNGLLLRPVLAGARLVVLSSAQLSGRYEPRPSSITPNAADPTPPLAPYPLPPQPAPMPPQAPYTAPTLGEQLPVQLLVNEGLLDKPAKPGLTWDSAMRVLRLSIVYGYEDDELYLEKAKGEGRLNGLLRLELMTSLIAKFYQVQNLNTKMLGRQCEETWQFQWCGGLDLIQNNHFKQSEAGYFIILNSLFADAGVAFREEEGGAAAAQEAEKGQAASRAGDRGRTDLLMKKWQYEFLVQFLSSPLWRVSILDFVDNNCVVFDNEEQNKFEYTKIHNQFKDLVANLFDGMMQEICLDEQKLVILLEQGFQSKNHHLFEQLLLCDDFLRFKSFMIKRNRTLEQEALQAMKGPFEQERNLVHSSLRQRESLQRQKQMEEEQILKQVLEMSLKQAEEKKAIEEMEAKARELEEARLIRENQQEHQKQRAQLQRVQGEKHAQQRTKSQIQQIKRRNQEKNKPKVLQPIVETTKLSNLPPLKTPSIVPKEPQPILQKVQQPAKQQQRNPEPTESKGESAQERKKRLLQQREKIRKKKEEQRKKMLEEEESHPRRANQIVLQEDGIHDSTYPAEPEATDDKVSKQEIERRKELMRKIKNRIVDDF